MKKLIFALILGSLLFGWVNLEVQAENNLPKNKKRIETTRRQECKQRRKNILKKSWLARHPVYPTKKGALSR